MSRLHTILEINDDFTDNVTDLPALLHDYRPLAVAVVEGKREDYRKRLGHRYGVRQRLTNEATAGTAIIWDRARAGAIGAVTDDPSVIGSGWLPMVEPGRGDGFLTRGVAWQDLDVTVMRRRRGRRVAESALIRVAAFHRTPRRERDEWPVSDPKLADWFNASPIPVALGMDSNEPGGPDPLVRRTVGGRWHGVHIDGFLTDLPVRKIAQHAERNAEGHGPIVGKFDLRNVSAARR